MDETSAGIAASDREIVIGNSFRQVGGMWLLYASIIVALGALAPWGVPVWVLVLGALVGLPLLWLPRRRNKLVLSDTSATLHGLPRNAFVAVERVDRDAIVSVERGSAWSPALRLRTPDLVMVAPVASGFPWGMPTQEAVEIVRSWAGLVD